MTAISSSEINCDYLLQLNSQYLDVILQFKVLAYVHASFQ